MDNSTKNILLFLGITVAIVLLVLAVMASRQTPVDPASTTTTTEEPTTTTTEPPLPEYEVIDMGPGGRLVHTKCDHGNRVYQTQPHYQGEAATMAVVPNDPSCAEVPQ